MNSSLPWQSVSINYCAFAVAVCRDIDMDEAFDMVIKGKRSLYKPVEEVREMIRLREEGKTFKEIGQVFGLKADTVFMRIKRYNKRLEEA